MKKAILSTVILPSGGTPQSPPTAAMGWRESWITWLSTLYQGAQATPVTADGQSVYDMNGLLGVVANSYFRQATAGNRPLYKEGGAGGKPYLLFDGTDDFMASLAISNFFANNAKSWVLAFSINTGWANTDFMCADSGGYLDIRVNISNQMQWANYDGSQDTSNVVNFTDNAVLIVSGKHDGGKLYIRKSGGAWDAGVASGNTTVLTGLWRLGIRGTAYTPMSIYGHCVANTVVSDANFALVENYFKAQLGIA